MSAPTSSSSPPTTPNAFTRGTIHRLSGWRWLLFWPAALGLNLYYRTLRFSMPEAEKAALAACSGPRIFVTWHNRSLLVPMLLSPVDRNRVVALISASKAAAWEVAYFEHWGIQAIRGSTTRRGIQAVREMLATLKAGNDLILGPDGPNGPLYSFQKGALLVARKSDAPIVLITANAPHAKRLKTWDRHLVPYPFSRVELRAQVLPPYSQFNFADETTAAAKLRSLALELSDA